MMDINLSKKLQGFRKQIRREQIQTFKKNRRKELIEWQHNNENGCNNDVELQQTYWGVLRQHELSILQQMCSQTFQSHIQMLKQVIMSQKSFIFIDSFEKIMTVLVDFYEIGLTSFKDEAYSNLINRNIDEDQVVSSIGVYALIKLFNILPVNGFLVIIGAIYHDIIASSNIAYLRKVVIILKQILDFSFMDIQTVKRFLSNFGSNIFNADYQLNKAINKNFIFTTFLNISFSEEDNVLQILKKENVFGRILESVELYGISQEQYETLCGVYCNSIEYLCRTIHEQPIEHQEYTEFQHEQVSSNNLYLPLFQQLLNVQSDSIIQNMVHISTFILKTVSQHNLSCKLYIIDLIQGFIRKIIFINEYFPEMENLYIMCANTFDFKNATCPTWLIDFLELILKSHLTIYFAEEGKVDQRLKQRYKNKKKGVIVRDINQLMRACQILLYRSDQNLIDFQESLVNSFFDFWCKEDPIIGYLQLITFLQVAIDKSQELSHWIILDSKNQEFVNFLDYDYKDINQIQAILQLIHSTCNRIEELKPQTASAYLRRFSFNWRNILMRIDGQCHEQKYNSERKDIEFAINLYERVDRMIKSGLNE